MVKPPIVYVAGLLRARRPGSTPTPGSGSPTRPANASSTRRTSPGGTTALARHRHLPRPLDARQAALHPYLLDEKYGRQGAGDAGARCPRRARLLGPAALEPATHAALVRSRAAAARHERLLEAKTYPALRRERAAPADPRDAGAPGRMTDYCCDDFTRNELRAAPGRPACPRSSRGCRCPPARGSTAARSSRGRRPGARRSTAREAAARRLRRGDRARGRRARAARPRLGLPRRRRRRALACSPRPATPQYRTLRPKLALDRGTGPPSPRTTALHWHPSAAPLATLHGEGKVTVLPAIGYADPDQSHFTSRHYWEVGATDPRLLHGLARPLPRPRRHRTTTRCRACRSTGAAAGARDDDDAGRGDRRARPLRPLGAAASGATSPTRMLDALGALGAVHAAAIRRWPSPAGRRPADRPARGELSPFAQGDHDRPVAYPTDEGPFPRRLAGLAAMLGAGLPLRCVALDGARHLRHARQPGRRARDGPEADLRLAARLPARPRGARARRPGARARLVGVRPPREENGSLGTDHGAAGSGFLIGSRANGRHGRRVPGPRHGSTTDGNLRATADFRGVYARSSSSGSARTRTRSSPAPAPSRGRRCSHERALALVAAAALGLGAGSAAAAPPKPKPPARLLVVAQEFDFRLSRLHVPAGLVRIEVVDFGEDRTTSSCGVPAAARSACRSSVPESGPRGPCASPPAATSSGARSETTASAGCTRRCASPATASKDAQNG